MKLYLYIFSWKYLPSRKSDILTSRIQLQYDSYWTNYVNTNFKIIQKQMIDMSIRKDKNKHLSIFERNSFFPTDPI